MARITRALVALGPLLVLAVLGVNAALVTASLVTIARSSDWVEHTWQVIAATERSLTLLTEAETGQRSFLLTGRDGDLAPYRSARSELMGLLGHLRSLTRDNGAQQARIADLERTAAERMAIIEQTLALRRQQDPDGALGVVKSDRGRRAMDRARRVVAEIRAEEERLLERRTAAFRAAIWRTVATTAVTTGTALLLLAVVSSLQRRDARGRDRAAAALRASEAWLSTTLASIGDAVIATDGRGHVRFMNPVAGALTGWDQAEAAGRPMGEVFRIVNEQTRRPAEDPVARVIREGVVVGLANHTVLVARGGAETPIDDSAAPIRDDRGRVAGVVLVFRDVTGRRRQEEAAAEQTRLAALGRDVGRAVAEGASLGEMLARCTEATVAYLDGASARIWTLAEAGDVLELQASSGIDTPIDGPHGRVPLGRSPIGPIARERRPHRTNAVIGDPRVPDQEWARREGMVAFAGYPLVVEDRLVGVWAMFARHPLSEATLREMESAATGIALGIERKRAAVALAASEARKGAILQTALDAIITIDHRGEVLEFNPAAERTFGHGRAAVLGRPLVELIIPPALRERHLRGLAHYLATGEGPILGRRVEVPALRADGSEFPVELAIARIPTDGPPLFTAHVRDITERRRTEEALRESESLFRTLADSIPQLAWMARPDGYIFWYNRRCYDYTGMTPGQIEGWGWQVVSDPSELPRVLERFQAALASEEPWEDTFRLRRHDGVMRWHLSRALPVRDDQGRVVRWFGTNTDITDRRQMEEELRVAKEEAEHANQAKDQFLAVLSHELRTPLNPILLAATAMLERPTDPEDLRPTLEMIRQNVNLQARLIDDLLDVMRIVRGKMPLHWEVADCHRLIGHAVGICRSEVLGKALRLEVDLAAGHHYLNADPARLQQVFWNLIKNAVKFTPSGGTIAIRTRNEGDPGGFIAIEVRDTGIGIAPDVLPLIFDPFQQGEATITRRFGGLGLGLAICRGIVEAHGGTLSAASAGEGRGATFRVVLPALPKPAVEGAAAPQPDGPVVAPALPSALKMLVVEDEPATLRLMARLLRGLGHAVTTAHSIASATEAIEAGDFELIISDIGLPDGSGLDLMRRVVARCGPLPAIALTGYGMEEDIRRSREAGFTAHLTKPIDFTKLEAMIQQVAPGRS